MTIKQLIIGMIVINIVTVTAGIIGGSNAFKNIENSRQHYYFYMTKCIESAPISIHDEEKYCNMKYKMEN